LSGRFIFFFDRNKCHDRHGIFDVCEASIPQ
jgi:hypothetical protein